MLRRKEYEEIEEKILAPYAMKSAGSSGRQYQEASHPFRTAFQRDRDRIIHSNAFRRLEYKTQVFVYHEGDHYRTRLTHTLEGSQIARTIARALSLNEDLAEAIILAHDLGHTPFGHSGEEVMNELMKEEGGFEHNRQSLRIVTLLESRYPDFPGLNLSQEVLEGIDKHVTTYDQNRKKIGLQPTLEAQIVDIADEIAYSNHDLDDGIRSGLLTPELLSKVNLWREHFKKAKQFSHGDLKVHIRQTIKMLINTLVSDLISESLENLKKYNIQSVSEVRHHKTKLISLSPQRKKELLQLKAFLYQNMYKHYKVERMADKSGRILKSLFETYLKNPKILPTEIYEKTKKVDKKRSICDYIAGMTDRFALDEYKRLFDPHERVSI